MKLHEYQSKFRFAEFGIPVPRGKVATHSRQAYEIAQELDGPVVVKAQVLVGGRGKAGGVKLAKTPDEAQEYAEAILNMEIKGLRVHKVLIDPAAHIEQEIYLGITNDRQRGCPVVIASSEGGVEIEIIAKEKPEAIIREWVDPLLGLHDYQIRNIASGINLPRELWREFTSVTRNLFNCYNQSDAELAEINPLVISDGHLLALDGKIVIDDNALYRHKDLSDMRDTSGDPESETLARDAGISYVKLDGEIGCMVNGAGLAMTTMDMIKLAGGFPANFLDIGGGARAEKVATALRIILADTNVKSVLLNIFGGITRGDEVARGVITAYNEVRPNVPMVVRLQGTNAVEGRAIINEANLPRLIAASTLTEAAEKAVAAAKGEI